MTKAQRDTTCLAYYQARQHGVDHFDVSTFILDAKQIEAILERRDIILKEAEAPGH